MDMTAEAVLRFTARLRESGVRVSTRQTMDIVAGFGLTGFVPMTDARSAARSILAASPKDFPYIDAAVVALIRDFAGRTVEPTGDVDPPEAGGEPVTAIPAEMQTGSDAGEQPGARYSALEVLRRKDFGEYTEDDRLAAQRVIDLMSWQPPLRKTRRMRPARRGQPDIRRSLRRGSVRGGEMIPLARQTRKSKPRPIVVLCDVSGSMSAYTKMLLYFLHVFQARCGQTEVFLFGTRLTRATAALAGRRFEQSLRELEEQVVDWSGGTRTGHALSIFHRQWARRVSAHGAITIVISDGLDRGETDQLRREMARLQRLSHRLIWLNPLLGTEGYEPLTQGMRAALPYIDTFTPAHNLLSIETLAQMLANDS